MYLYPEGPLNLYLTEKYGLTIPVYWRNSQGADKTYCNIFAYDLLDSRFACGYYMSTIINGKSKALHSMGASISIYDYDIRCMLRDNKLHNLLCTPIEIAYANILLARGSDKLWLVTPEQAQSLANIGTPVLIISRKYNHIAVAAPPITTHNAITIDDRYNKYAGCYTANAGAHNDFMFMSDCRGFGTFDWQDTEILYVLFNTYEK